MSPVQPELVAANGRRFAGFAAAVLLFIVDPGTQRFLLLSSPAKRGRPGWEVVNGGLEAGESVLEGVAREAAEEVGPAVSLSVVGTVHAWTWHYDDLVTHMLSIAFVARYLGGEVVPGDDMAGSTVRWASLEEVRASVEVGEALIPGDVWLFERALEVANLWPPLPAAP
ncbi:MAG TPA: NUDIX hydrolase [Acidimicrobiales bacterium]|nr:NUDIX hydrolase [Acidimicrobiales bacterium]